MEVFLEFPHEKIARCSSTVRRSKEAHRNPLGSPGPGPGQLQPVTTSQSIISVAPPPPPALNPLNPRSGSMRYSSQAGDTALRHRPGKQGSTREALSKKSSVASVASVTSVSRVPAVVPLAEQTARAEAGLLQLAAAGAARVEAGAAAPLLLLLLVVVVLLLLHQPLHGAGLHVLHILHGLHVLQHGAGVEQGGQLVLGVWQLLAQLGVWQLLPQLGVWLLGPGAHTAQLLLLLRPRDGRLLLGSALARLRLGFHVTKLVLHPDLKQDPQ